MYEKNRTASESRRDRSTRAQIVTHDTHRTNAPKLVVVCQADSFLRTANGLLREPDFDGFTSEFLLVTDDNSTKAISLASDLEVRQFKSVPSLLHALRETLKSRPSAVIFGLVGRETFLMSAALRILRPTTFQICFISGIAWPPKAGPLRLRAFTDIFILWSKTEIARFHEFYRPWMRTKLVLKSLPGLACVERDQSSSDRYDVVFWAQAKYPETMGERRRLLCLLALHYDSILLKIRSVRGSAWEPHDEVHHYEDVLNTLPEVIRRKFTVFAGSPEAAILAAPKSLTISSTAILECLSSGQNVQIVADFGVSQRILNDFAIGSGLVHPIKDSDVHIPDVEWMDSNYLHDRIENGTIRLPAALDARRRLSDNIQNLAFLLFIGVQSMLAPRIGTSVRNIRRAIYRLARKSLRRIRAVPARRTTSIGEASARSEREKYLRDVRSAINNLEFEEAGDGTCPICDSHCNFRISRYPSPVEPFVSWSVHWCQSCGSGTVRDRGRFLEEYYRETYATQNRQDRGFDPSEYFSNDSLIPPRYRERATEQLAALKATGASFGTFLDVGSGPGYAIHLSQSEDSYAVEPDSKSHNFLTYLGTKIVDWNSLPVGVISSALASHSIEHIPPEVLKSRLTELRKCLNPAEPSRLLVEVPNGDLQTFLLYERHEPHTIFFTMKGLTKLFENNGFEVLEAYSRLELNHQRRPGSESDFSVEGRCSSSYGEGLTVVLGLGQ